MQYNFFFFFNCALDETQGGEGVVFDLRIRRVVNNANPPTSTDWIINNVTADKIFSPQIFMKWTAWIRGLRLCRTLKHVEDFEYDRPFGFLRLGVNSAWLISTGARILPIKIEFFSCAFSMDFTENRTYKRSTRQLFAVNCVIHSAEASAIMFITSSPSS